LFYEVEGELRGGEGGRGYCGDDERSERDDEGGRAVKHGEDLVLEHTANAALEVGQREELLDAAEQHAQQLLQMLAVQRARQENVAKRSKQNGSSQRNSNDTSRNRLAAAKGKSKRDIAVPQTVPCFEKQT
jgi:hypothetical protein